MPNGEGLRGGVGNLYQLFIWKYMVNFVYFEGHFDKFVFPDYTECY